MTLFPDDLPKADSPAPRPGKRLALTLHFDGGSRGNPGPAGIGVVLIDDADGEVMYELGDFLGRCTSNVAEYTALIRGLAAAKIMNAAKVTIKADSELVVRQINGVYKVKSPDLKPLFLRATALMREIGDVTIQHVYREGNARADELANEAMDKERRVEPMGPALNLRG